MGGKVYLVGAGPGDPELITVKGWKCIQKADVLLYDRLANPALLDGAKRQAERIYCGKRPGKHALSQEAIHQLIIKYAKEGKIVVRLKGGDPFVFGRGGEEAEALLDENIPFEIVPGITAGIAAAAYAGIPVTHRLYSGSFAFVTGHRKENQEDHNWKQLATSVDTLAIYMGMKHLSTICQTLMQNGKKKDTPVALIHWGTISQQKTVVGTLETIGQQAKEQQLQNPTMIIVGEVVRLREKLQWFEQATCRTLEVM